MALAIHGAADHADRLAVVIEGQPERRAAHCRTFAPFGFGIGGGRLVAHAEGGRGVEQGGKANGFQGFPIGFAGRSNDHGFMLVR